MISYYSEKSYLIHKYKIKVVSSKIKGTIEKTYRTIKEHKPLARSARLSVSSPSTFQVINESLLSSSSDGLSEDAGPSSVKSILEILLGLLIHGDIHPLGN